MIKKGDVPDFWFFRAFWFIYTYIYRSFAQTRGKKGCFGSSARTCRLFKIYRGGFNACC